MHTSPTMNRRRRATRVLAVGACAAAAATLGVGTASANPNVTTTVTQQTLRLVDEDNGILYFVNKSRADLCTPERLAFEAMLVEWLDGGAVGDPPAEPASSQEGLADVSTTSRLVGGREMRTVSGDDVPVEAWLLDGEEGGIDCTATDGPGAALFASGPMDFTNITRSSDMRFTGDTRLEGVIVDPEGTRWRADVNYSATLVDGEFSLKGGGRLVELG